MGLGGIYVSVPFCRAKCSFCNFASGVFAADRMEGYLARVLEEVRGVRAYAARLGVSAPAHVDSLYLGGGTPSLLEPAQIEQLFRGIRAEFDLAPGSELTVECAPGQLTDASLEAFQAAGVNRLSFGVQSFVDAECAAVGRTHTGAGCLAELERVRRAGMTRVGVDLIVGLPGQTAASWRQSVDAAAAIGVEHVSLYVLEVDEDSRLGREALAGGTRYGAASLPDEDAVVDWCASGWEWLEAAGLRQYEISNFARPGGESRHNRKYWQRDEYVGFGLDAHSMLRCGAGGVRWANASEMSRYVGLMGQRGFARKVDDVGRDAAFEEALFLGLRLVEGVSLDALRSDFGPVRVAEMTDRLADLVEADLVCWSGGQVRLTARGRMCSNEVFGRLLLEQV